MIDEKQRQIKESFDFKWAKRDVYESNNMKKKMYKWLVERYFGTEARRKAFLRRNKGKRFLDAGCGSGLSASLLFGKCLNTMEYVGADISDSIKVAQERFKELGLNGVFLQEDLTTMRLNKKFDIIFCEGVIPFVSQPFKTVKNLVSHLEKKGVIMFYVCRKKAPIREFTDDFIREKLKNLNNEQAWNKLIPLTKLGKILGNLNVEIKIDEDIELLEIPKGKYNLQRFFYWFFLKAYYDKNFTIDQMNLINFDWYRPLNCYRFEHEEIKRWLKKLNLKKLVFRVEEAGITVIAKL
jgi:ubiquinone/menaquinone biosynthesis C-methylase UbiE